MKAKNSRRSMPENDQALTPTVRWNQTIGNNLFTLILLNLLLSAAASPAVLCLAAAYTGKQILLFGLASILAAGVLVGPTWAATSHIVRDLQFGFPNYLWRSYFSYLKDYLRRGALLGIFCTILAAIPLTVIAWIGTTEIPVPLPVLAGLLIGGLILPIFIFYVFEQLTAIELNLCQIIKNSVLLIFLLGWRSLIIGLLCMALEACILFYFMAAMPVGIILGIPVLICITCQALTHKKMLTLLTAQ